MEHFDDNYKMYIQTIQLHKKGHNCIVCYLPFLRKVIFEALGYLLVLQI